MKSDWIYTQEDRFMRNGKPIFLRGLGVGSWLNLEHFMMGVPGWDGELRDCLDTYCPDFTAKFTQAFFAEADAKYIRSLGINFIRVPLNHHLFWNDQQDRPNPFGLEQLERLAAVCKAQGLYFLLDMHTTPGGQNPDWHSECKTGVPAFWEFQSFRSRTVKIWEDIAFRFQNNPVLLGYDLLNEPVLLPGQTRLLNDFYRDTIAAIRKWDADHIVFLEGDRFSMDFTKVMQPQDTQWAYTYHFYPGVWDEKILDPALDRKKRRTAFTAALDTILGSMQGHRGPLLCGEMGYELACLKEDFALQLTEDTIRALEDRGSGWCLWCYKDAHFMGLTYPAENSSWMRLVEDVAKRWNHHQAAALGREAAQAIDAKCAYSLTEDEKYRVQFIIRAALAHTDVTHILQPLLQATSKTKRQQLADSFRLDRCDIHQGLEALLRVVCL